MNQPGTNLDDAVVCLLGLALIDRCADDNPVLADLIRDALDPVWLRLPAALEQGIRHQHLTLEMHLRLRTTQPRRTEVAPDP